MTRRQTVAVVLVATLAFAVGAVAQLPMAQAARLLPELSGGRLDAQFADGVWFDGRLQLTCRTPGGRRLDCGRYALKAGLGPDAQPGATAVQPGGGRATLGFGGAARRVELNGLRLPMAALALALPIVEQMRFGGDVVVDGRIDERIDDRAAAVSLDLRWQSEIGGVATGEQRLRVEGGAGNYALQFQPPAPGEARAVALSGGVRCEILQVRTAARCRGEVEVKTAQADPRFESLLAAAGPRIGPGHYRLRIDSQ